MNEEDFGSSGGDGSSSFDSFLSNLEYSAAAGLSAGINRAFGSPTLAQSTPAVVAPSSQLSTQTILLLAGAAVVIILLLK
jgi:hypothetical protein